MSGSIVCGVDPSQPSRETLGVAERLARRLDARLILLTVARPFLPPPPGRLPSGGTDDARDRQDSRERRARRRLAAAARAAGMCECADLRVATGDPARCLIETARREDASFLVVGSSGRGPIRSALLGSVSARLVRAAPCPVLVLPPPAEDGA